MIHDGDLTISKFFLFRAYELNQRPHDKGESQPLACMAAWTSWRKLQGLIAR